MQRVGLLLLSANLLATSVGCSAGNHSDQARVGRDSALARSEIEARGAEFIRLYEANAVEAVAEMFTEDAHLMPPGVPAVIGREAIRAHIAKGLRFGVWRQSITRDQVVASGPLAIERGRYVITYVPGSSSPAGSKGFRQVGRYLIHWHRENGVWRIANYAGSNDGPPVVE